MFSATLCNRCSLTLWCYPVKRVTLRRCVAAYCPSVTVALVTNVSGINLFKLFHCLWWWTSPLFTMHWECLRCKTMMTCQSLIIEPKILIAWRALWIERRLPVIWFLRRDVTLSLVSSGGPAAQKLHGVGERIRFSPSSAGHLYSTNCICAYLLVICALHRCDESSSCLRSALVAGAKLRYTVVHVMWHVWSFTVLVNFNFRRLSGTRSGQEVDAHFIWFWTMTVIVIFSV